MFCEKIHKRSASHCIYLLPRDLRINGLHACDPGPLERFGPADCPGTSADLQFWKSPPATQLVHGRRRLSVVRLARLFEGKLVPDIFHITNHSGNAGEHPGDRKRGVTVCSGQMTALRILNAGLCAFYVLVQKSRHGVGDGPLEP